MAVLEEVLGRKCVLEFKQEFAVLHHRRSFVRDDCHTHRKRVFVYLIKKKEIILKTESVDYNIVDSNHETYLASE